LVSDRYREQKGQSMLAFWRVVGILMFMAGVVGFTLTMIMVESCGSSEKVNAALSCSDNKPTMLVAWAVVAALGIFTHEHNKEWEEE
jgi:hypothetical protein